MSRGFGPQELLECYARGVFPMADGRDDPRLFLVSPDMRGVLPLDDFHLPRRLARTVRSDRFEIRLDSAFDAVVAACASAAAGRTETWINRPIAGLYGALHRMGHAHALECWLDGRLVGGLYGVHLRGAFFGESMFSLVTDASKVALVHLVAALRLSGLRLLDTQFQTAHLARFGTREIPRDAYQTRLAQALDLTVPFPPDPSWRARWPLSGEQAVALCRPPEPPRR